MCQNHARTEQILLVLSGLWDGSGTLWQVCRVVYSNIGSSSTLLYLILLFPIPDAICITAHAYIILFVFVMTSTVVPYGKVPLEVFIYCIYIYVFVSSGLHYIIKIPHHYEKSRLGDKTILRPSRWLSARLQ